LLLCSQNTPPATVTVSPTPSAQLTFDGRHLTTTDGNTVRFWDVTALAEMKQHKMPYPVEAASYCPAKGKFACGGGDMWVRLHAYEDGSELECNRGHHGPVHTIRFGPEGKEYASVSWAGGMDGREQRRLAVVVLASLTRI
jgi:serine-threonine kinase receptor-associated protein